MVMVAQSISATHAETGQLRTRACFLAHSRATRDTHVHVMRARQLAVYGQHSFWRSRDGTRGPPRQVRSYTRIIVAIWPTCAALYITLSVMEAVRIIRG